MVDNLDILQDIYKLYRLPSMALILYWLNQFKLLQKYITFEYVGT